MAMRRIIYALLLALSFAMFLWWEDYIVHLLFYFVLLLPPISLVVSLPLCFLLRCRVGFSKMTAGKNGEETLVLSLRSRWIIPSPCVRATMICENELGGFGTQTKQKLRFSVGFAAETEIPVALSFPYCGKVNVRLKYLRFGDLLGIFSLPVLHRKPLAASIFVMPDLHETECAAENGADLGQESTVYSDKKPGNDPAEIFRLRDYRPGDRPHAIHWKLSARLDRLTVREFGLPLNVSVRFLFELDRRADLAAADRLLETFYSIASFQLEQGAILTAQWLSAERTEQRTVTDEDTLAEALHGLLSLPAVSDGCRALADFAQGDAPKRCHLIYLTASPNLQAALPLLEELLQNGTCRRISVLTVGGEPSAESLRTLPGCDVFSLSDGIPSAGLEELRI